MKWRSFWIEPYKLNFQKLSFLVEVTFNSLFPRPSAATKPSSKLFSFNTAVPSHLGPNNIL